MRQKTVKTPSLPARGEELPFEKPPLSTDWKRIRECLDQHSCLIGKLWGLLEGSCLPRESIEWQWVFGVVLNEWLVLTIKEQMQDVRSCDMLARYGGFKALKHLLNTEQWPGVSPNGVALAQFDLSLLEVLCQAELKEGKCLRKDPRITAMIMSADAPPITCLSAKYWAERVGVTPERLQKLFKSETGLTLHKFVERLRARRAAQLIRDSSLRIKEITALMNYSETSNFCRDFRKVYGNTPKAYRMQFLNVTYVREMIFGMASLKSTTNSGY